MASWQDNRDELIALINRGDLDFAEIHKSFAHEILDNADARKILPYIHACFASDLAKDLKAKVFTRAQELAEQAANLDPDSRAFVRQLRIILGNFAFLTKEYDTAESLYQLAANGDTHAGRIALARLNLCRLYFATDQLDLTLKTVELIALDKLPTSLVSKAARLLKVRVFVRLGFVLLAEQEFEKLRGDEGFDELTLRERDYLGFVVRYLSGKLADTRRQDYMTKVAAIDYDKQRATFELEYDSLAYLDGSLKIPAKTNLDQKLKYLTSRAKNSGLKGMALAAIEAREQKFRQPTTSNLIRIALEQFHTSNSFAAFCFMLAAAEQAIYFRRFEEALICIDNLQREIHRQRHKVSTEFLVRLSENDRSLEDRLQSLMKALPSTARKKFDATGTKLLDF